MTARIELDDGAPIRVVGYIDPGSPGYDDEPAYPPYAEIESVTDEDGNEVALDDEQVIEVSERVFRIWRA